MRQTGIVWYRAPFLVWEKLVKHSPKILCCVGLMIPALATIENGSPARADYANASPQVSFGSHQWPTLITSGPGAKTLADLP